MPKLAPQPCTRIYVFSMNYSGDFGAAPPVAPHTLLSHSALPAFVIDLDAIERNAADLTRRAANVNGAAAAPLGLYPLWCAFATALSTRIWMLNR